MNYDYESNTGQEIDIKKDKEQNYDYSEVEYFDKESYNEGDTDSEGGSFLEDYLNNIDFWEGSRTETEEEEEEEDHERQRSQM